MYLRNLRVILVAQFLKLDNFLGDQIYCEGDATHGHRVLPTLTALTTIYVDML